MQDASPDRDLDPDVSASEADAPTPRRTKPATAHYIGAAIILGPLAIVALILKLIT